MPASRIFQPFREIGKVTSDIPFVLQTRGTSSLSTGLSSVKPTHYLTVAIGDCFQIYDMTKFRLVFVSDHLKLPITTLQATGDYTFVATGGNGLVHVFKRAKIVFVLDYATSDKTKDANEPSSPVSHMLVLGEYLIVIHQDNSLRIWDFASRQLYSDIELGPGLGNVTALIHPSTYLNKIVIAGSNGKMQIWNVRSMKMIYEFNRFKEPVTSLAQSPVIDVLAIGLADGSIHLLNIREDKILMNFAQDDRVTSISFRTDDQHIMATASNSGDVALWDLEKRRLIHLMKNAHDGFISSLQFINGNPLLITSAADNSIKEWIFDGMDGAPRLLRQRSGHHAPPTSVKFYDEEGHFLLTASRDRSFRTFSTHRDEQNVELSQGSLKKKAESLNVKTEHLKFPYPIQFCSSTIRQLDWDNIISCHVHSPIARTWSFDRKAIGKHTFKSLDGSNIMSVGVSACGNFGLIGTMAGRIEMFNIQSGIHRKTFGSKDQSSMHKKSISGIVSDNSNRKLITSSIEGTVKIWDFQTGECLKTIEIGYPISCMKLQADNDLVAIACDDFCIRLIDIESSRVVREFHGHRNRISDFSFSPDDRWLISSSLDATVRVWDIPTGYMIDIFRVDSIVTSLDFSPKGDFLATSHVNSVGICLWANRTNFSHVNLTRIPEDIEVEMIDLPVTQGFDSSDEDHNIDFVYQNTVQIEQSMITLSSEPKSKWQNLLHLDTIKKRNKPKEAPKAPEKAPFFLPTLPGLEPKFLLEDDNSKDNQSRILKLGNLRPTTELVQLLKQASASNDYTKFYHHLKALSPSSADFEIRSLDLLNDFEELKQFMESLIWLQSRNLDFELIQSFWAVVVRIHGDIIIANSEHFKDILERSGTSVQKKWSRLEGLFHQSLCLIDHIRQV